MAEYVEGAATEQARLDLVKERLRLFFVGLTRARQELVVTWNRGQQYPNRLDNQPAIPFVALQTWWAANGSTAASESADGKQQIGNSMND